jgi:hypothetical protein
LIHSQSSASGTKDDCGFQPKVELIVIVDYDRFVR